MTYSDIVGCYSWSGQLFATDLVTQRPLVFPLISHGYTVTSPNQLKMDSSELFKQKAHEAQLKQQQAIVQQRAENRMHSMIIIVVGNIFAIVLGIIGWFFYRKVTLKRKLAAQMNLVLPD